MKTGQSCNSRKSLNMQVFNGAPGRIRTSGLLIRSYTETPSSKVLPLPLPLFIRELRSAVDSLLGNSSTLVTQYSTAFLIARWVKGGQMSQCHNRRQENACYANLFLRRSFTRPSDCPLGRFSTKAGRSAISWAGPQSCTVPHVSSLLNSRGRRCAL